MRCRRNGLTETKLCLVCCARTVCVFVHLLWTSGARVVGFGDDDDSSADSSTTTTAAATCGRWATATIWIIPVCVNEQRLRFSQSCACARLCVCVCVQCYFRRENTHGQRATVVCNVATPRSSRQAQGHATPTRPNASANTNTSSNSLHNDDTLAHILSRISCAHAEFTQH